MNKQPLITHRDLCMATAKRFNKKVALYEYKSFASINEQPDVLIFDDCGGSVLFEIKVSLSDFKADRYKKCRRKYRMPMWAHRLEWKLDVNGIVEDLTKRDITNKKRIMLELKTGKLEIELVEREHLGIKRYFVCPWGVIPVDMLPEGWGLYYYKNGKFFIKKESGRFRTDLWKEVGLAIHALRRYASGDNTGIMVNTYWSKA